MAAGADPNALDRAGYTPLAWARERDHRHEVPGATVAVLELVSALEGGGSGAGISFMAKASAEAFATVC